MGKTTETRAAIADAAHRNPLVTAVTIAILGMTGGGGLVFSSQASDPALVAKVRDNGVLAQQNRTELAVRKRDVDKIDGLNTSVNTLTQEVGYLRGEIGKISDYIKTQDRQALHARAGQEQKNAP